MALGLIGSLYYEISANSAKFDKSLDDSKKKAQDFEDQWKKTGEGLKSSGESMDKFLTVPILALGTAMLMSAGKMEQYQTTFSTLLGSGDKAKEMLTGLKEIAEKSPFSLGDLTAPAQELVQLGMSASKVVPTIAMLGDVAMGNKDKLAGLTFAYQLITTQGELTQRTLMEMKRSGFDPLITMSQQTGESIDSLTDKMKAHAISADMVTQSLQYATSAGGMFHDGMAKGAQTLEGQWSKLLEQIGAVGRSFGEILLPIAKDVIKQISEVVKWFGSLDDGTKRLILTIGGIVAISGPVISAIGGIMTAVTAFNPVLFGITVGVIALIAGLTLLISNMKDTSKEWHSMNDMVQKNAKSVEDFKKSLTNIDFGAMSIADLKKGISESNDEIKKLQAQMSTPIQPGKFTLNVTDSNTQPIKDNNAEYERQKALQEQINALIADRDLAQEELTSKTKTQNTVLTEQQKENAKIRAEFATEEMTDVEKSISEINKKADAYIKAGSDKVAVEKWASAQIDNIIEAATEKSAQLALEDYNKKKALLDKEVEDRKKAEAEKLQAIQTGLGYASTVTGQVSSIVTMQNQNEINDIDNMEKAKLNALDAEYAKKKDVIDKSLASDKNKTAQQAKLDAEYAKQKDAITKEQTAKENSAKRDAFNSNKVINIANAVIGTAQAVIGALANSGNPYLGMAMAAVMAGLGAVQIGTIATQTMPAFAQGGTVLPQSGGSVVRVAEAGEAEHIIGDAGIRKVVREEIQANNQTLQNQPILVHMVAEVAKQVLFDVVGEGVRDNLIDGMVPA